MPSLQKVEAAPRFDPTAFKTFWFLDRSIDAEGNVILRYALDDLYYFEECVTLAMPSEPADLQGPTVQGLLALLHLCAGVSYYKTAIPSRINFETEPPAPAAAALLEALYSEGLGEFAVVNRLERLPRPSFSDHLAQPERAVPDSSARREPIRSVLVPVGGGKDSAVAIEVARATGLPLTLFSVGNAGAIQRTVDAASLPRLLAVRTIDRQVIELNRNGAMNGHVPITAIVATIALLTAALHGLDAVALANERSASAGNTKLDGVEVNHQFSKSLRAERLLARAAAEVPGAPDVFSVLRPASELSIARRFSTLTQYHSAFTSCNRIFKLDASLRLTSWCCDCDKCRFVFLILAPFIEPGRLEAIFGKAMLDDDSQYEGFALLTATGGDKPFECVGEVEDSVAALRLLEVDERWRGHSVLGRLLSDVLPLFSASDGGPEAVFRLSKEHLNPPPFAAEVDALLGA